MNGKVCARCRRELYPMTNGVLVIEHAKAVPGPYKIYHGDLWACRGCNTQVVVGIPHNPIAEHWQPEFSKILAAARASGRAIECFELNNDETSP